MDGCVTWHFLLVSALMVVADGKSNRTIFVESSSCGDEVNLENYDIVHLKYRGRLTVRECRFTFKTTTSNDICVYPKTFTLSCSASVFFDAVWYSNDHDEEYRCDKRLSKEYCSGVSALIISFEVHFSYGRSTSDVHLKVFEKNPVHDDETSTLAKTIAEIAGGIAAAITKAGIIYGCCRRYRDKKASEAQQNQPAVSVAPQPQPAQPVYQPSVPLQNHAATVVSVPPVAIPGVVAYHHQPTTMSSYPQARRNGSSTSNSHSRGTCSIS